MAGYTTAMVSVVPLWEKLIRQGDNMLYNLLNILEAFDIMDSSTWNAYRSQMNDVHNSVFYPASAIAYHPIIYFQHSDLSAQMGWSINDETPLYLFVDIDKRWIELFKTIYENRTTNILKSLDSYTRRWLQEIDLNEIIPLQFTDSTWKKLHMQENDWHSVFFDISYHNIHSNVLFVSADNSDVWVHLIEENDVQFQYLACFGYEPFASHTNKTLGDAFRRSKKQGLIPNFMIHNFPGNMDDWHLLKVIKPEFSYETDTRLVDSSVRVYVKDFHNGKNNLSSDAMDRTIS